MQHYLVIDPDTHEVTHHRRMSGGTAAQSVTNGALRIDPPGIELDVGDLFA